MTLLNRRLRFVTPSQLEEHGQSGLPPAGEDSIDELQFDRLDWLKTNPGVDTLGILRGAGDTLWRLRPCMLLAASGEEDLESIAGFGKTFSYRMWRVDTPYFSGANFNCRTNDIFPGLTHIAALAIPEEVDASLAYRPLVEL